MKVCSHLLPSIPQFRHSQKVYLPAITGHIPPVMVRAVASLIDFYYLVRRNVINETALTQIQSTLDQFHQHQEIFCDAGIHSKGFSLPRQHSLNHYVFAITEFGAPNGLCSSITELRHIKAVKRPYCRSGKNKLLGQMLITNQRIDKLAAAHTFFNSRGMLTNYPGSTVNLLGILSDQIMRQPQANHVNPGLSTQPVLERRQTPVDEHERYDARAEDNTEARAEIRLASTPGAHYSLYSTFFLPTLVRKLPQELNLLAQKIRQPDLPLLTHRFLFRVLNPDSPVPATAKQPAKNHREDIRV